MFKQLFDKLMAKVTALPAITGNRPALVFTVKIYLAKEIGEIEPTTKNRKAEYKED